MNFSKKRPVKIVMLGAGGTGAHIAPHLYRLLYALERPVKFIICDGDKVEPKNLVRQNFTEADLGENKARVIAERYSDVFGLETSYIPRFIEDAGQLEELLIHDGLTAGVQCPMCRQTITEQTLPQVKGEFAASLRRIQAEGCQLTAQCKEVQELDAKARTVFEQFREDDIAAGEAELEELSGQRKQALEQAEERRNFHQQELERLHSEIQSTELDRECGMLSQEEIEELNRARTEFAGLNAKIEVLSKLVQASPEAAGKQEQDIKQMQASIQQKKELLSALAFYISKRVEINFSKLRMNRVSITLYDVVKSTGEVKDVFRFTYEGRDYICLSHSERIRAGLEVAELIKRLLGVEYPTFIDDVESVPVIDNVRPTGQVFIAKVIKGTALQVQVADNTGVPKAA